MNFLNYIFMIYPLDLELGIVRGEEVNSRYFVILLAHTADVTFISMKYYRYYEKINDLTATLV